MVAALAAIVAFGQWQFRLDTTFRTEIMYEYVNSIAVESDGVILSGVMRFPAEMSDRLLTKLNEEGDRIPSFPFAYGGGKLTRWNDRFYVGVGQTLRRVWPTGVVDGQFNEPNLSPYFTASQGGDYHVYEDGRVLVTGSHMLSDSIRGFVGSYQLIWFSNQGYLDTTRIHRQANGLLWRFTALPDGKFLCSCNCSVYDGQPVGRIFRIHEDGSLDTTFQTDVNSGSVAAYYPLADGRVLVGGNFRRAAEPDQILQFVRFMPDGSLDPSFNNFMYFGVADGLNSIPKVTNIVYWQDDMYFVMGVFRNVDGETRGGICVVDTTGQLLPYMDECLTGPFTYFGNTMASVHGIVPTPDGTGFYINGTYTGYTDGTINDTLQRFVSRLLVEEVNVAVREKEPPMAPFRIQPNPAKDQVTFTYSQALEDDPSESITIRDLGGKVIAMLPANATGLTTWYAGELRTGVYMVEYVSAGSIVHQEKLIVAR